MQHKTKAILYNIYMNRTPTFCKELRKITFHMSEDDTKGETIKQNKQQTIQKA